MSTPCEIDRYLWTSDLHGDRKRALDACATCHRLTGCHEQTRDFIAKGLSIIGVSGGVDYSGTPAVGRAPVEVACGNPECGETVTTNGTRRRYCGQRCSTRAAHLRKVGRAA